MGKGVLDEHPRRTFRLSDRKIMVRTEETSHGAEEIAPEERPTGESDTRT